MKPPKTMHRFQTVLAPGTKRPYASWTFLIIPADLADEWGAGQKAVRGTISGEQFRGTVSRGEGMLRMPVPRAMREQAGVRCGDTVEVAIELDTDPRPLSLPDELRAIFNDSPEIAGLFDQLPPSHRRAWAAYVDEAKLPETRTRRARKAPDGIRAREFPR
jgi:hypothetical protein